jgi:hypothetical protein
MTLSHYYAWLKRNWAETGLIMAIFITAFLFIVVRRIDFVLFVILLQTPLYLVHETEEYVFPGGFAQFFNRYIYKTGLDTGPFDDNAVFYINMGYIWIPVPLFGMLSCIHYSFGAWIPYFVFYQGFGHIALAIVGRKLYNPGLAASLVLNIPVGFWSMLVLVHHGVVPTLFLNTSSAIGLGVNLTLPVVAVLLLRNYRKKRQRVESAL